MHLTLLKMNPNIDFFSRIRDLLFNRINAFDKNTCIYVVRKSYHAMP